MGKVYVIGVGMTKFEKPGVRQDDYPILAKEAILKALDDCKINYTEIQQAFASYVFGDSTSGQRALYEVGMTGIPIYNVNNNCASGSSALLLAKEAIEFGRSECVLALGFEKMNPGSISSKFLDRTNPLGKHIEKLSELVELNHSPIVLQFFANAGIEYMKKYGATPEHFAKIAHKNHKHSVNNSNSQFRNEYSLQEILNSPKVLNFLTKLQCCPTSDGAAVAILASERFVKSHNLQHQAVEILGIEMSTDFSTSFDKTCMNLIGYDMTKDAAERLFRKTNCKPSDVQVVELHDCFSVNELIAYEALGLCPQGKAAEMIDRGDNTYGGKYVVNPSGGLISKGHPLGATGLAQCAELCWQLRGDADKRQVQGAKLALQHNIGMGGAVVVALYSLGFPEYCKNSLNPHKTSAEVSEYEFRAAPYLRILEQFMQDDDENLVEKFRGIYGIKIKKANGIEGFWLVNAKEGKGSIEFNNTTVKPDVTLTINDADIIDFLTGRLNPQQAFFKGKINIKGNMGLALKLTQLQQVAAKKLDGIRSKL